MKRSNIEMVGVLAYFAMLAVGIPYAQQHGWGFEGIMTVMGVCAAFLLLIYGIYREIVGLVQDWMKKRGTTSREFAGYLAHGHAQTTALAPAGARSLALTAQLDGELGALMRAALEDDDEGDGQPYSADNVVEALPPVEDFEDLEGEREPEEEAPVIIEANGLHIAETFVPSIESVVGQQISVIGNRRKGKSTLITVLCEELARYHMPILVLDVEDVFRPLASSPKYFPRGVLAGSAEMRDDVEEGLRFHELARSNARKTGRAILQGNLQVIVNLTSYTPREAAVIVYELIAGMEAWQQERPPEERIPCFVVLDEATTLLPQRVDEQPELDQTARGLIQKALFDIVVRRGGKRGFGLIAGFQKVAEVDKRLLQGQWKFVFCQSEELDLKRAARMGLNPNEVRVLPRGECFVFCPQTTQPLYLQVRRQISPSMGGTPSLANLARHRKQEREARRSVTGVLAQLSPAWDDEEESASATEDLVGDVERETPRSVPAVPVEISSPSQVLPKRYNLEQAAELWNNGADSLRKLQAALGITYYQASEIHRQLRSRKLID